AEASPLLAGVSFARRNDRMRMTWGNAEAAQLDILTRALASGAMEVELTETDLQRLENPERPPMLDAFHAIVTVTESRVVLHAAMGPSGARMLGRFCHTDDAIRASVEQHLRAEEALRPDAIFAELVHLPAGRVGNILARPVLREYEIPFLGSSGAPRDRQISVDDLMVMVSGDQIRLRSKSLDREVIPRLSTAHNTMAESLGVYRFLAALQRTIGLRWDWGPLDTAPFLPRIVSGRVVLSRARWHVGFEEFGPIAKASGAERYRLAQRLREERRMPRYVMLTDNDQELLVDFENTLSLDAFLDLVRRRQELLLTELYPMPDELCARGPEGRYFHELIVPFTRRPAVVAAPVREEAKAPALLIARTFPPGSEWQYVKLYTGTATADRVLLDEIAPLAREAVATGAARRWFFIRYADPHWHLRVRFHGEAPGLTAAIRRLVDSGAVWKVQYDTYEREIERYGGPEAIELAEEIFYRDSEAVVSLLASCDGDTGADDRWRFMLAGIDRLLADFGYDLAARLRITESSRDAFARQFQYEALRERLADRFRNERATLDRFLDDPIYALDHRSSYITPIARELLTHTRLTMPVSAIVPSLTHMYVNRLARSAGPEHELVLYDYLVQLYRSRIARAKREGARLVAS
ncbi:MAG TPA: thiopeptide-type bacteriocin biosynthesis protein, partial [Thermoanaerobaculia bacterium]|nr:thiopeptide-type bacteriocin biosynthesis protein [Thermoanaerobaculia bacterium]